MDAWVRGGLVAALAAAAVLAGYVAGRQGDGRILGGALLLLLAASVMLFDLVKDAAGAPPEPEAR